MMTMRVTIPFFAFFLSIPVVLNGCAPAIDNRGYETENRDFKKIIPGNSTKQFVEENFGSPSTVSNFHPETWYYVSKTTEAYSFLTPKVVDFKSYAVVFDANGIVSHVLERNGDEVREINPVKRQTPTAGYQSGLLREIFSNFGKIVAKGTPRSSGM